MTESSRRTYIGSKWHFLGPKAMGKRVLEHPLDVLHLTGVDGHVQSDNLNFILVIASLRCRLRLRYLGEKV
jgi:hypothetical protein